MKRRKAFQITILLAVTTGMLFLLSGQGAPETITMAGSTSMEKLAVGLAEAFMEDEPSVVMHTEFTGSSAGIEAMLAGSADIAGSSRALSEQEKSAGAVEHVVAVEAIVVITDASNDVTALTSEQLIGIYAGTIRNWRELGGADIPVVVVGREAGSGTRVTFERLLGMEERCAYGNELDSTGAVMARVASTPGAVGYVSRDVINETVQAVSIDGMAPTDRNISDGVYPFVRPLIIVTKGEIAVQKAAVRQLFAYLHSEKGRRLIEAAGLIVPEACDLSE